MFFLLRYDFHLYEVCPRQDNKLTHNAKRFIIVYSTVYLFVICFFTSSFFFIYLFFLVLLKRCINVHSKFSYFRIFSIANYSKSEEICKISIQETTTKRKVFNLKDKHIFWTTSSSSFSHRNNVCLFSLLNFLYVCVERSLNIT